MTTTYSLRTLVQLAEQSPTKCKNWLWRNRGAVGISLLQGSMYVEYYRLETYDDDDLSRTGFILPPRAGLTRVLAVIPLADTKRIAQALSAAHVPVIP